MKKLTNHIVQLSRTRQIRLSAFGGKDYQSPRQPPAHHTRVSTRHPQSARSPGHLFCLLSPHFRSAKQKTQPEMEPATAAGKSPDPMPSPPPEVPSPVVNSSSPAASPAPPGAREVAAVMEAVERDAAAIAESYASLFASLRVALSNVRTLSSQTKRGEPSSSATLPSHSRTRLMDYDESYCCDAWKRRSPRRRRRTWSAWATSSSASRNLVRPRESRLLGNLLGSLECSHVLGPWGNSVFGLVQLNL